MKYFGVIFLSLMILGAINKGYLQAYYNVIKDASFEENSEFWEENFSGNEAYATSHYSDTNAPDGDYIGITFSSMSENGFAELRQKFVPRIINDFGNLGGAVSLIFQYRLKCFLDGCHEFGLSLKSKQGNVLNIPLGRQEEVWEQRGYPYLPMKWKRAGLPETDSLEEIILWSKGRYDSLEQKNYGQEVRWDNIRLFSERFDIDGAVISIDSPKKIGVGRSYIPKGTLKNVGALDIAGVRAACQIVFDKCGAIYTDTVACYCLLKPDDTLQLSFKEWIPENPSSDYYLTITFLVNDDQNLDNNSLTQELEVTGIEERIERTELTRIKVKPSIFAAQARLYLLPGEKVRIYNPNGKLVEELYDSDHDGIIIFGSELNQGVYFYETARKKGKFIKIE